MKTKSSGFGIFLASAFCATLAHGQAGYGYSFAWGEGASAGWYSFAQGYNSTAEGNGFAFGDSAFAGESYYGANLAFGAGAVASTHWTVYESSISIGDYSDASLGSVSLGYDASSNYQSLAVGAYSRALQSFSAAFGRSAQAIAPGSLALGFHAYAPSVGGVGLGLGNKALKKDGTIASFDFAQSNDPILMVGNSAYSAGGISDANRSNAVTVYRDGDMHVAGRVRVQPGGDIPMFSTVKPSGVSYP